jgi:anhydro-N-acetylmuramic acid kinase
MQRVHQRNKLKVDFIASHGHTIFHRPQKRFTYQLGNGAALHSPVAFPLYLISGV